MTMSRKKKDKPLLENIVIEDVAAEGNALAHYNGKVLFVPGMVPGDVVDVQVRRERKGYIDGYAARLVTPSPHRIEPVCEHFGECGGCKWQCLPYAMQLAAKQQQAVDQLTRIGHLQLPDISPIIGSDLQYYYRNKLEFTFSNKRWILQGEDPDSLSDIERLGLGFHISGFFDKVLDLKKCHLMAEPCNEIRNFIKAYAIENGLSFFDLRAQTGFLRNLILREASTGEIMLTVVFGPDAIGDTDGMTKMLEAVRSRFPQITSLNYVVNPKANDTIGDLDIETFSGRDCIYEQMGDLKFKIGPKSFYQTNSAQAFKLYSVVRNFASSDVGQNPVIYDLYTGTGTIALFLSSIASKVVGVEYVPEAIEDAKQNAAVNGIGNCTFYAGDMKDVLNKEFIEANGQPDLIVLDPPRSGIHPSVAQVILEASPAVIIYVSCNPASQARDLAVLCQKYDITAVQPVDMFPQTHHVENVVKLLLK